MTTELWDIYDADRKLTGRTHRRGDTLADGEFHLVAHLWLVRSDGRILITQRSSKKQINPLKWETTHGAVLAGETTLNAAIRECYEETGLDVSG